MDDVVKMLRDSVFDTDAIQAVILTNDLKIVWMSPALEIEFGPLKDFVGKTCYEAFAGDEKPHVDCTVRKTIESRVIERSVNKNRTYATVAMPLGDAHVAEIIMALPKEGDDD
jgi:hypothetical protein